MQNGLVMYVKVLIDKRSIPSRTSHRSRAKLSRVSRLGPECASSLSAGTPKLPLVPLLIPCKWRFDGVWGNCFLPPGKRLTQACLKGEIQS